jgi:hypothetical protein
MQCRDFLNARDGSIAFAAQAPVSSHRRFDTSLLVRSAAFLNRCPQSEKWQWDPGDEVAWHVPLCLSRVIGMAFETQPIVQDWGMVARMYDFLRPCPNVFTGFRTISGSATIMKSGMVHSASA